MIFDRTLRVVVGSSSRAVRLIVFAIAASVCAFGFSPRALAVLTGVTPGVVPNTTVNPANCTATSGCGTWTQGDPGWANAGQMVSFSNAVYLGDGWVISAQHTGVAPVYFTLGGPTYTPIPNQTYSVPNPTGVPNLTAVNADLKLFRINADPGLPSLTIASQPLALNDEVLFASYGPIRAAAEKRWVDTVSGETHTWTEVGSCNLGGNCYGGYENAAGGKRWGTNVIANDNILGGVDASDSDITTVVSNTTIANLTTYDQVNGTPFEAQVAGGDSGSAVFHKRGAQWELAGIVVANYTFEGQSSSTFNAANTFAVYNNASAFADLSSYYGQITSILAAHSDYSIAGDINLDGVFNSTDISAFVANWGYNNGTGLGSVTSWKHGDLNHDGRADVADFFKMRTALGSSTAAASLAAALGLSVGGGNAVPEPSAVLLVMGPALLAVLKGRRRRLQ